MRLVGLVGGTTWLSTLDYYRYINEEVSRRLGGVHSARLVLHSIDFAEVVAHAAAGDHEAEISVIVEAALSMERAGAQLLALCANTAHIHARAVAEAVSIPLVHIVDEVAAAIIASGMESVGVLCTRRTRSAGIFDSALSQAAKIAVLMPSEQDQDRLDRTIVSGVERGFDEEDRQLVESLIGDLLARGTGGVVLGCTELPLILGHQPAVGPCFDTTRIHAKAIVDLALSE